MIQQRVSLWLSESSSSWRQSQESEFRNDAASIHGSSATRSNVWHGQQMVSIFLRYVFVGRNVNITPAVIVRAGQPEKRFQFVDHDGRLCTSID